MGPGMISFAFPGIECLSQLALLAEPPSEVELWSPARSLRRQIAGAARYCPVIHIPACDRLRGLGLFSLQKGKLQ